MSHKDAPPETPSQIACREFWERAQPTVTRAWGRAKDGSFLAEESRLLHKAWEAAQKQQPAAPSVDVAVAIRAFEEHYEVSSDDPYFEGELELWLTAWRKALASQQQGGAE